MIALLSLLALMTATFTFTIVSVTIAKVLLNFEAFFSTSVNWPAPKMASSDKFYVTDDSRNSSFTAWLRIDQKNGQNLF